MGIDEGVEIAGELGERAGESVAPLGPVHRGPLAVQEFPGPRDDPIRVLRREADEMEAHEVADPVGERRDQVARFAVLPVAQ